MRAASSLATRLAFNNIDAQTVALLKEAREFIIPAMPAILDGFYDHVGRFSETNTFFRNREHMMHAKAMQLKHWAIILEGRFDADYEASVTRIGEVHNKLGLEPRWYIGGYNALLSALVSEIAIRVPARLLDRGSASKRAAMQRAVINAAILDMDIAISVYIGAGHRDRAGGRAPRCQRQYQPQPASAGRPGVGRDRSYPRWESGILVPHAGGSPAGAQTGGKL